MKLLQINVTANWGSTGRIAEEIGQLVMANGWESYIAYGRYKRPSKSRLIKIASKLGPLWHLLLSRLFDKHGLGSHLATKQLIRRIKDLQPDIIHLHNIHGYYLNYKILFDFLAQYHKPIVWTLHDCWSFTGHCAYFDQANCNRWESQCFDCPLKGSYPASFFLDQSSNNYNLKKSKFTQPDLQLVLVPVSNWLAELVCKSFLRSIPQRVIHNGIDVSVFKPHDQYVTKSKFTILGVASKWDERKGLSDFLKLRRLLPVEEFAIILVGLNKDQINQLPDAIVGIDRTNNVQELVNLYAQADVFVNPTYSDNYPTTNLEAMSCGTPVITYETGGSPEAITDDTGFVVKQGNIEELADAICTVKQRGKSSYKDACRRRAENCFDKNKCYQQYLDLYQELVYPSK